MPLLLRRPHGAAAASGSLSPAVITFSSVTLDPYTIEFDPSSNVQRVYVGGELPDELYDAAFGPVGRIYRRVDIYDSDAETLWMGGAPVIDGSVSVDMTRTERRTVDLTLDNEDFSLSSTPRGFWYSKIIKVWRGVETDSARWETQIGEFLIDSIAEGHFPHVVRVAGRDYAKRLAEPFDETTQFNEGSLLEDVVRGIAAGAGMTKFALPATGLSLTRSFSFESNKPRADAIKEIVDSFGWETFVSPSGYFTLRPWVDPFTAAPVFTFQTGVEGNLAAYEKVTNDTEVRNRVVVLGKSSDRPPVYAVAENDDPNSPTAITYLGPRTYHFESSFITDADDAQALAYSLLSIHGLESYDVDLDALVVPWLEGGDAIDFIDPRPAPGDPTRFLLTSFDIPLSLGTMSAHAKRITLVGS